jgi:hypothetical protein
MISYKKYIISELEISFTQSYPTIVCYENKESNVFTWRTMNTTINGSICAVLYSEFQLFTIRSILMIQRLSTILHDQLHTR